MPRKPQKLMKEFEPGHGFTKADWDAVSDNPPLTDEQLAQGRPLSEVLPEFAASLRPTRGKQKAPTKRLVSLRLDQDVIEAYKAGGDGWQARMNDTLRKGAKLKTHAA